MAAYGSSSPETELTRLMKNYETDVVRLCFLYLRDLSLAEDAAQETFLKVYRSIGMFRRESSEKTWLMRIAINTCKDIRRGAWFRHVDRSVSLDHLPSPSVPAKTESILLTLDVMQLPLREREAVLLRYWQNMTVEDVAEVLGISGAAVSKRLKRAHQKLHMAWEGGNEHA